MAPPNEPPTHITLRIKVPPGYLEGGTDTFTLPGTLAVTTKIAEVRELIRASLPTNPAPERQRLLYFGRALVDNDQTVADALNIRREPSQNEYVVHLLVRGGDNATPAPRTATPPGQTAQQHGVAQHHEHGLAQHFQQHQQQVLQHQHMHGVLGALQPDVLAAQARLRQEQLQAELRTLQTQAQMLNPRAPAAAMLNARPDGERTATPPNVPSQQAQPNVPSQQAQPSAAPLPGQPNAPAVPGQPRTQNIFMQGIGPNGERIAVHHQQRVFQHTIPNPNHLPPGAHGHPAAALGLPSFGMPNPQQPQAGSSSPALDRAREQIAELRRLLEDIRAENPPDQATPEQSARIARMQEQARNIDSYIDPLNLASANGTAGTPAADPTQPTPYNLPPHLAWARRQANNGNDQLRNPRRQWAVTPEQAFNARRHATAPRSVRVPPPANPDEVTCYLLSDPAGQPQALLLTPQHGTYTGTLHNNASTTTNANPQAPPPQAVIPHAVLDQARVVQARRLAANGNVVAVNPMALLLRHFWLLLRIMIFSYFLLGSNMGWRRPLALGAIALGFWLMRAGMLGDGGVVRGWWDEIVREGAAAVEPARPAGAMPTPEEVARRLMEERRRGESEWMRWGRERVRAVVLLLASLWPGVGEAFVRAREAEERRLAEEEVAEGRRREEEAARIAAEEAEKNESEATGAASASEEQVVTGDQAVTGEQAAIKNQAVAGESVASSEATVASEQVAVAEKSSEAGPSSSSST